MPRPTMRAALEQIVRVLGPNKFGCSENLCQGCTYEGGEALRLAREALGVVPGEKLQKRPAFVRHQPQVVVRSERELKRAAAEDKRAAAAVKRARKEWLKGQPTVGDTVEYQERPKGRWRDGRVVTVAERQGDTHFKVQGGTGSHYYPAAQVRRAFPVERAR